MRPAAPKRLGPYELRERLGAGAFGQVFEAWDEERQVLVALKLLSERSAEGISRFKREARIVGDLAHPNIVVPWELARSDGHWFLAMERVSGRPFGDHVRGGSGPSTVAERSKRLAAVLQQLCEAINALHSAGVLHLDLKPANVLVRSDGRIAVLDFGLAYDLVGRTPLHARAALAGTPR